MRTTTSAAILLLLLLTFPSEATTATAAAANKTCDSNNDNGAPPSFGVDVSYPIHRLTVSSNYDFLPHNLANSADNDPGGSSTAGSSSGGGGNDNAVPAASVVVPDEYKNQPLQPLGNKQSFYDSLMLGCRSSCKTCSQKCDTNEADRIAMNVRQPQSMRNYTDLGIQKIRAPEELMTLLTNFWQENQGREVVEAWPEGNTYVNHWEQPSYMLSVESRSLKGGGATLKQKLWDSAVVAISEWTGQDLTTSSLYGIRVYKDGAVLAPHVDRLPLVSSAIINVAQDVDEPWPIEVYTHDGLARNITMEPGDMVLYESHSVVHGRPFPLKGKYYANVFIHFQPKYEDPDTLPSYVLPDSPEAKKWTREHMRNTNEPTEAHRRAQVGDIDWLKKYAAKSESSKAMLTKEDQNGWTPLHEASRGGFVDIIEFLLGDGGIGADVNHVTEGGDGKTPLGIALGEFGKDHPVVKVLKKFGGME